MATALFTHWSCLEHETGPGHPENPGRLSAVLRALDAERFQYLDRRQAPAATLEQIERVHTPDMVAYLQAAVPITGIVSLDGDTVMSPGSFQAALHAAGAVCAAVDAVMAGEVRNAFCAVRPPGHHAEPGQAMGFCLFNNVGVGAEHARAVHGLRRVAIVDFDVHHGNGTQALAEHDPGLFYGSTHEWPLYPGTGALGDQGDYGTVVNVLLRAGSGGAEFREGMSSRLLPALDAFAPQLILISAGFDAHRADPLADLTLVEDDFAWVTAEIAAIAQRHCQGRLVSSMEGGYDPMALASCVAAHVGTLMEV
ncbi:histone deacetylase family protein [Nitrospirillum iridis]|uniref:Acetoin utilization deacetylase AcuC-like enzyme n=1 Tax=Nitrospirillum iridis TaxID=765888 RepID=A0A7X0EEK9_9PROT|nr:histone deacetylase family protein [Nitrospirillum iridis]MBB6253978.1 acetoin utilization deacetylase AcuC-like enzyme [Nitrospirillum iridis]